MRVYVMQDRVSRACGSVFDAFNDDTVVRDFTLMCKNGQIPAYAVRDTVIICLGEFDSTKMVIVPEPIPYVVVRGDDIEIEDDD